jgi:hypothetical protein
MVDAYEAIVRRCNGKFSEGKDFRSDKYLVFTELIYEAKFKQEERIRNKQRTGLCTDHLPKELREYTEVVKTCEKLNLMRPMPTKGLLHDPLTDSRVGDDMPWWFKIGPALVSTGVGQSKNFRCLLRTIFQPFYDFFTVDG